MGRKKGEITKDKPDTKANTVHSPESDFKTDNSMTNDDGIPSMPQTDSDQSHGDRDPAGAAPDRISDFVRDDRE